MGKRKEDVFAKAKEIEKKIILSDKDADLIEPADRAESFKAKYVIDNLVNKVVDNCIKTVGFDKLVDNSSIFDMTDIEMAEFIVDIVARTNSYRTKNAEIKEIIDLKEKEEKEGIDESNEVEKRSRSTMMIIRAKALIGIYKKIDKLGDLNDYFINKLCSNKNIKNVNALEKIINNAGKASINVDDMMPDDSIFENPMDNGKKNEVCTVQKEIDALKEENKNDPEFLKVLEEAKTRATIGNQSTKNFQLEVAEKMGKDSLTFETSDGMNYFASSKYNIDDFDVRPKSVIFSSKVSNEKIAEYARNASITFPRINDDLRARLLNIEKYIDDNGYGDNLDELEDMKKLMYARKKVEEAVKSKNKDEIAKSIKEYDEVDHFYKTIYQFCDALTPFDRFPNNMSKARVITVPFEYRNEVKGTSYLRAIIETIKFARQSGLSFEDFLNDPVKSNKKMIDEFASKVDEKYSVKDMEIVDAINSIRVNSNKHYGEENAAFASIGQGMTFLASAVNDETSGELRMKANVFTKGYIEKRMIDFSVFLSNSASVSNLIAVEKEDRDLRRLYTGSIDFDEGFNYQKKFDITDYYLSGKTTPSSAAKRILDVVDALKKDTKGNTKYDKAVKTEVLEEAIKPNTNILLSSKTLNISETCKKVLTNIKAGTVEKISKTDRFILEKEAAITKAVSNDSIKNAPNKTINVLAELKANYNSRNIFLKLFGPETNRLSRTIKNLTDSIVAKGIAKTSINEKMALALRGELENEKPVEPIKEIEAPQPKKPYVLDLDEEEAKEEKVMNLDNDKMLDLDEDIPENNNNQDIIQP